MTTRPKPWESGPSAANTATTASVPTAAQTAAAQQAASDVPPVPARPTALNSVPPTNGMGYGNYGGYSSGYGSGYGTGYSSGYGTGYGGYGSGYGGYSSGYGGYGSGYGSMGGMGSYGMGGMGGMGMNNMNRFPGQMENSTAATFQLIESIVGAFGGFAQMLESTYMATHSSFFAMMSVAEQFGHLKQSLGSILGIFAILRWSRSLIAKLTGRAPPANLSVAEFAKFSGQAPGAGGAPHRPRASFKPLVLFLAAVFGFPYLIGRLVKTMANGPDQQQLAGAGQQPLNPSSLEFCRALYDFIPENPQVELQLQKGDLVAILSTQDPTGNQSQWWRVRSRDGRTGYVPSTYLEVIPKQGTIEAAAPAPAPETKGA